MLEFLGKSYISEQQKFFSPLILQLVSFLHKPVQRLTTYTKFLKSLSENDVNFNNSYHTFLSATRKVEVTRKRMHCREVIGNLVENLSCWEGPDLTHFGDLILYGNLRIIDSDLKSKVKEFEFYLLEKLLVICEPRKEKSKRGLKMSVLFERILLSGTVVKNSSSSNSDGIQLFNLRVGYDISDCLFRNGWSCKI